MRKPYRIIPSLTPQDIERFWSKVNKEPGQGPNGDCHEWQGGCSSGYGCFYIDSEMFGANRVAYLLYYGKDPLDKQACHSCDNPPCCNGVHLWLGTSADNTADRDRKGRAAHTGATNPVWGEAHYKRRLTSELVQEVRLLANQGGANLADLARQLGVTTGCVDGIVYGTTWKRLPVRPPKAITLINNQRAYDRGSEHVNSKVTEEIVKTIRADYAAGRASQYELAARYGVSRPAIGLIVRRVNWKHVP